jgi:hypothetical protein
MKHPTPSLLSSLLLTVACAGGERDTPPPAPPPPPPDSLALVAPDGWEVWFTSQREATSAEGEPCVERALEIRRDTVRKRIPLMYTREAPTALGTDAIRAVLYNHCVPAGAYRVDFATVSPVRLP